MTKYYISQYLNHDPYIPSSLSEIDDLIGSMILGAPTFFSNAFPDRDIDSRFHQLFESFSLVRGKLGEERYSKVLDLARTAKTFFADDQEDNNGKADEGREVLFEIEGLINATRASRKAAKLRDEDGKITGD